MQRVLPLVKAYWSQLLAFALGIALAVGLYSQREPEVVEVIVEKRVEVKVEVEKIVEVEVEKWKNRDVVVEKEVRRPDGTVEKTKTADKSKSGETAQSKTETKEVIKTVETVKEVIIPQPGYKYSLGVSSDVKLGEVEVRLGRQLIGPLSITGSYETSVKSPELSLGNFKLGLEYRF